ncbi:ABC transporter permease [Salinibacterium sp. UTAS2018]|uniref:ABC transporter permease n=1 Tax=Salinibacterium sp. UTAS2018 TaxID=2508880 RepID=UPI0010095CDF|nr:ABC transporter permease [Salinibacterium sp. UTAS2018]QAV69985.1 ABC transporter permease [Salinibacterium sp. UTAS2018]
MARAPARVPGKPAKESNSLSATGDIDLTGYTTPGRGRGLLDVFRRSYLLRLLVRKGVSTRYRNSAFGWGWSYVKPLSQYMIYFFVMGIVLGRSRGIDNFAVYLLAGIIVINLFNEAFTNATTSVVDNKALVKKIYLPRELFPVAAVIVAFIHFLPQVVVLLIATILTGWQPGILEIAAVLLGALIVITFSTGLGLIFGAVNVSYRDAQNLVEIIRIFATWASPVLYGYDSIAAVLPGWLYEIYMLNPLTSAVELFHYGFWFSSTGGALPTPPDLVRNSLLALLLAVIVTVIGQMVFRKFERRFAQDL